MNHASHGKNARQKENNSFFHLNKIFMNGLIICRIQLINATLYYEIQVYGCKIREKKYSRGVRKFNFFSWSIIQLILYQQNIIFCKILKRGSFGQIACPVVDGQ
jgi:hypothetical protein